MPSRNFDDAFWGDEDIQEYSAAAKLLFVWSFTNPHCDAPGAYRVTLKTIAFETGLPEKDIPGLFDIIKKKVVWYPDKGIVWAKNFLKYQAHNPSFLRRARHALDQLSRFYPNGLANEILTHNLKIGICIPLEQEKYDNISKKGKENELICGRWTPAEAIEIANGKVKAFKRDRDLVLKELRDKGYSERVIDYGKNIA